MGSLSYSLIIPTLNRPELLKKLLSSIARQSRLPSEIVLVDQSDDELTREAFERWQMPGVDKKYLPREVKSLVLARNAGIDACGKADLVAFLDDDITLDPNFCEELVLVLEKDTARVYAGGMGCVACWDRRPKLFQAFFLMPHEGSGRFLASGAPTFTHGLPYFCDTEFVSGGCTFWRREIVARYRFDERLSGYAHGDDVDISYRVSKEYKLFFQPKAICFQDPAPPNQQNGKKYRRAWVQNMYYLAQKNGVSMAAYGWCVLGHLLRDLVCRDLSSLQGGLEGTRNILRGRLDTIRGYDDFLKERRAA
ncbi:MAG: glycosyltransferase family 2 protein [Candidatus Omnitrophica bacterium]|nr:glycosyltransferase family 2 protein [Candidatus Omnitrophota bacterium]